MAAVIVDLEHFATHIPKLSELHGAPFFKWCEFLKHDAKTAYTIFLPYLLEKYQELKNKYAAISVLKTIISGVFLALLYI